MIVNIIGFLVAVSVLALAIVVDLLFGDPSPRTPSRIQYKLHPTVWMGKLTSVLESHLKNPNPKIEKLNGVLLALIVTLTFTLPTHFGLRFVYTSLGLLVYIFVAVVILKLAICIRLETEWGIAAAKAIESGDLTEARKYSHFSRRDSRDLTGPQIVSSVIESMACGTPVLCSNASSLPEVAGNAAFLVDPLDVKNMAKAMNRLLQDKGLRAQLVERGLRQVRQFSWDRCARETLAVLEDTL